MRSFFKAKFTGCGIKGMPHHKAASGACAHKKRAALAGGSFVLLGPLRDLVAVGVNAYARTFFTTTAAVASRARPTITKPSTDTASPVLGTVVLSETVREEV